LSTLERTRHHSSGGSCKSRADFMAVIAVAEIWSKVGLMAGINR
jgi:hypothetical protein